MNLTMTQECVGDYCNGDACPDGTIGTFTATANGESIENIAEYVWEDGDTIQIKFG